MSGGWTPTLHLSSHRGIKPVYRADLGSFVPGGFDTGHFGAGSMVAAALVLPDDEVMLISTGGVLIRTPVKAIREMSRSTQGVTLINLDDGTKLAGMEKVIETDEEQ